MAPNPRVGKAFRAMRDLGIPEVKVKPVLKNLLKLYEKNWELIEEENYRVLADAIFDNEEAEAIEHTKKLDNAEQKYLEEEAQVEDEAERPLKRSRIRDHEGPVSSSFTDFSPRLDGASSERLKVEQVEPLESCLRQQSPDIIVSNHSKNDNMRVESLSVLPQPLVRNKGKHPTSPKHLETQGRPDLSLGGTIDRSQPCTMKKTEFDSISSMMHLRDKGKGPLLPEIVHRGKKSITEVPSLAACLIEPNVESGILSPKRKGSDSHSLIMPKDEPFSDDIPQFEVPIAVIHPDSTHQGNGPIREPAGSESLASRTVDGNDKCGGIAVSARETKTNCQPGNVLDESSVNLEPFPLGEVKISSSCATAESHGKEDLTPAIDFSKKTIASDTLDARGKPLIPLNGSVNIQCGSVVVLPQVPRLSPSSNGMDDLMQPDKNIARNGCEIDKKQNFLEETNSHSLVIVQQHQLTPDDIRSLHDANDIAKGQERFVISLINEINCEHPPSFRYIPQNIIFQNAHVNFSLAQIGDANCCSTCFGDCLSSPSPCTCSHKNGGSFAYTLQGLVKEEFLEECISINRDPQQQHLFYCKECPVERSKNDDTLEQCKGHIVRKFIKECWLKCGCGKQCGNRVVQRGINCNLQVFMTAEGKGWGLRTLEELPKGAFVCEYVGELLTKAEFFKRMPRSPGHEEQSYPVLLDADWCSEGVVKDEEALCLDATYYGNVARFINHRCFDSNLVEIPVEVETPDHHYYHLAFFTARKVEAFEELTWDYGINFDNHDYPVKAFQCRCGSLFCRNIKQ